MTDMSRAGASPALEVVKRVAEYLAERYHPQRIILFGSQARGDATEDSDIDIMLVMDYGDRESTDVVVEVNRELREKFPQLSRVLDIKVMKPSEFEASLLRKGIFVMTIVDDGAVLYEDTEATPIEELRQRKRGGKGMKPETKEWIERADKDLDSAYRLMQDPPDWNLVIFLAQQCTEKYLKAFLEEHGIKFRKTHDLVELVELAGEELNELRPLRESLSELTQHANRARYPGCHIQRCEAEEGIRVAEQVRSVIRRKLGVEV